MNKSFDTTLKVKNSTRDRLKKLGTCGDSYNSVLVRLLDKAEAEPYIERKIMHEKDIHEYNCPECHEEIQETSQIRCSYCKVLFNWEEK